MQVPSLLHLDRQKILKYVSGKHIFIHQILSRKRFCSFWWPFFLRGKGHCGSTVSDRPPPTEGSVHSSEKSSANFRPLSFMQFQILHSDLFSRHHLTFIVLFFLSKLSGSQKIGSYKFTTFNLEILEKPCQDLKAKGYFFIAI